MDKYTVTITGEPLGVPKVDAHGLGPMQLEQVLYALLAITQRELLAQRLGLPAFGQVIVAPPSQDGRR